MNIDRDNVDPLILDKISKLNNFIDKQQEEINLPGKNLKEPDARDMEYKSAFCNLRKGTEHSLSNLKIKSSLVGNNNEFDYDYSKLTLWKVLNRVKMENGVVVAYNH
ncbi:MAG: hypothetical protein MRQ07_05525, partial [Candidatus Midichloria sp.]|nr:hypothetical protein [Candidatus Midichloria sp.]